MVDSVFKGASFCKYVCPIGQFHFVHALVSPLEVKVRELLEVCGLFVRNRLALAGTIGSEDVN